MGKKLETIFLIILLFVFVMGSGYVFNVMHNTTLEDECNKYNDEYHIMTETTGNKWAWDASFKCFVIAEDGTKIDIVDFSISDYKKPVYTN